VAAGKRDGGVRAGRGVPAEEEISLIIIFFIIIIIIIPVSGPASAVQERQLVWQATSRLRE